MTNPPVSVVIVSRARPHALARCLKGVLQLRYDPMEVVVVADPAGCAAAAALRNRTKLVPFDTPNISAARNAGIAAAAGDIIAFLDDDAVPEPSWIGTLIGGMTGLAADAATGFVRGRNGISYQWCAQTVDLTGKSAPLALFDDDPVIPHVTEGCIPRLIGTNMAVRRAALVALGGFDPAFRFYLDETDLSLRLTAAGHAIAVVPRAEVHHGYLAGPYRTAERMPRTLAEIAASTAVFRRKHAGGPGDPGDLVSCERARLIRHLIRGTCEPRDVGRLLATLGDGWAEGCRRRLGAMPEIGAPAAFRPVRTSPLEPVTHVSAGRIWQARRLRAAAARAARAGRTTTLFLFDPSTRYHRQRFTDDGFWEQTGGLWGRSDRHAPLFQAFTFDERLAHEVEKVIDRRLIDTSYCGHQIAAVTP